jgi:hypothetical protein
VPHLRLANEACVALDDLFQGGGCGGGRGSHVDLHVLRVWPGVRPAGPPRLRPGAIAGPGAAQRRRLI